MSNEAKMPTPQTLDEIDELLRMFADQLSVQFANIETGPRIARKEINLLIDQAHRRLKALVLTELIAELKDVKPGKDSDLHHLSSIIEDRIQALEDEIKEMQG